MCYYEYRKEVYRVLISYVGINLRNLLYKLSKLTKLLTNFVQLSPCWETSSCLSTQEIPQILLNQEVLYCVHSSQSLGHIMSQINPVHNLIAYIFTIEFNIILPFIFRYLLWYPFFRVFH